MNQNNSDPIQDNTSSPVPSFWKPAQYGEWASYDDIIRFDPSLAYILKPENNFRIQYGGYNHSVKEYTESEFTVYRQKPSQPSSSQSRFNSNRQSSSINQFKNKNFNQEGLISTGHDYLCIGNKKIEAVKVVKEDEQVQEGWEIFNLNPVLPIDNERRIVLVKWEVSYKD